MTTKQVVAALTVLLPIGMLTSHIIRQPGPDIEPPIISPRPPVPGIEPTAISIEECRTLRQNDIDIIVRPLREALRFLGYLPIDVDTASSEYDLEVRNAIIQFQLEMGIVADGITGPQTYARLDERLRDLNGQWVCLNL